MSTSENDIGYVASKKWEESIIKRWLYLRKLPEYLHSEYRVKSYDFLSLNGELVYGYLIERKRRRKNGKVN